MSNETSVTGRIPGDAAFRRKTLKGSSIEASYAGALSFMRRKYTRDLKGVDVAVTGIPFDQAVTNRPGTRFGPEGVRRASVQHAWGPVWPWRFDPFETLAVVDYGDCFFDWGRKQDVPRTIERHIRGIIDKDVTPLTIGGDHFVTYPVLKALAKKHGPLGFIHFDAHRDVEPDEGGRIDHGTMFNYAVNEGVIDAKRAIQVGIRTCYAGEKTYGMEVMFADEVQAKSADEVAKAILKRVGEAPTYLTFDIDFLDPAYAPGTGTPVPGGMSSFQALAIIRALKGLELVGMDVVEVSPPYDHADMTSNAGAMIALELLCLKAWAKGARPEKMTD
jgi:agmatinase